MSKRFFLRYKSTPIAVITETESGLAYESLPEARSLPYGLGYPIGIYPVDFSSDHLRPDAAYVPTGKDILFWLGDRVFPKEREGSSALLKAIGLSEYDEWEIAKKTRATTYNDDYWLSDDPSDRYEDVHPRAKLRTRKTYKLSDEAVNQIIHRAGNETRKGRDETSASSFESPDYRLNDSPLFGGFN